MTVLSFLPLFFSACRARGEKREGQAHGCSIACMLGTGAWVSLGLLLHSAPCRCLFLFFSGGGEQLVFARKDVKG